MKQQAGFNIIEVLVVMAIIGLIASIGWPTFIEYGRTNNRADGILATTAVALALNKFGTDQGAYTWTTPPGAVTVVNAHNRYLPQVAVGLLSDGGSTNDITCANDRGFRWVPAPGRYESCRGYYSITVDIAATIAAAPGSGDGTNVAYLVTTTAIAARPQSNDYDCNAFTLNSNGQKGHIAIDGPANEKQPVTDQGTAANVDGPFHSTRRCWGSD